MSKRSSAENVAVEDSPKALTLADLEKMDRDRELPSIDQIDDRKNYEATLQLGARRTWRTLGPGEVVRDPTSAKPRLLHKPAIKNTGPIPGSVLKGLVSLQEAWWKKYQNRQSGGLPMHQLLVLNWSETDKVPPEIRRRSGLNPGAEALIRTVVSEAVREAVAATIDRLTAPPPSK